MSNQTKKQEFWHKYDFRLSPIDPRQVEYRTPKNPEWREWGYYSTDAEAAQKVQEYSRKQVDNE